VLATFAKATAANSCIASRSLGEGLVPGAGSSTFIFLLLSFVFPITDY